jgi:protein-disulfide isomerase
VAGAAPTGPSLPALPGDAVVATWNGGTVTAAQLDQRVGREIAAAQVRFLLDQYERQSQALDMLVVEALLSAEVQRRGLADVDALLKEEVEGKVADPTEEEIVAFFPVVQRQLPGATLDEARPILVSELVRRGREERYGAYIRELRAAAGLQVRLPYPDLPRAEIPLAAHDPSVGPATAPVTIVQFAEYQCYYCNLVNPTLEKVKEQYGDKVRIVWKDYPLSNHGRAVPAAVAAHCAGEQGKYWEMSRLLLQNQHALSDSDFTGYAADLGLAAEPFQACTTSGRYESLVQEDFKAGNDVGVQATPTFFVNGVLLSGAQPLERFQMLIDRELKGS